jgi:hypothetical protein
MPQLAANPDPSPAALADDGRSARERQEAINAYNARRAELGYPPFAPDEIARKLALDEEVRQRAAAMRRHDEQKHAGREAEEQQARRSFSEMMAARIDGIRKAAPKREASGDDPAPQPQPPEAPEVPAVAQVIMFPQWGDERRAAAAAIFRSALFPPLNFKKARPFLKEAQIYATKGIEIYFTGEQFDQSDLDVYLELLHIAHEYPFGVECCFTAYGLLKALGRATGKHDHEWLHSVLIRLRGGTVDMTDHEIRYFGGLIEGGFKEEKETRYRVRLNPEMARVFRGDLWASLDIQQRRDLKRSQTAKAVHAYLSSNVGQTSIGYEKLANIIGLKNTSAKDVKRKMVRVFEAMKEVGFVNDFEAGTDIMTFSANHTPSQTRHLIRKATSGAAKAKRRKTDTKGD